MSRTYNRTMFRTTDNALSEKAWDGNSNGGGGAFLALKKLKKKLTNFDTGKQ